MKDFKLPTPQRLRLPYPACLVTNDPEMGDTVDAAMGTFF